MRVLHTVGSLAASHGGPSRTIPALCNELASLGTHVELVTQDLGPEYGSSLLPENCAVRSHKVSKPRALPSSSAFHASLLDVCRGGKIELLHDHGMWLLTNHAAARVATRLGLPRVVSPRGMLAPWSLAHQAWKKRLVWRLFAGRETHSATLLHATSEQEANDLRELSLRQPIAVIPNGVDLPPPFGETRHVEDRRLALFLSRIHPKKGLPNLIEAWSRLQPDDWRLLIVGPDEAGHKAELEALIRKHGLGNAIGFGNPASHGGKWEVYHRADLFVLPTHSENFGVVVAEALACGVPVITTRGAPWAELEEERCGWWVEIGVEPLAAALSDALSRDRETLRSMGRRGRELVERRYAWSVIARRMQAVYAWLLDGNDRPETVRMD